MFGGKFIPCVQNDFELVSCQCSSFNHCVTFENSQRDSLSILASDIGGVTFDVAREIIPEATIQANKETSEQHVKGTFQLLEREVDVTNEFAIGMYHKAFRYKWRFTNPRYLLQTVICVVGVKFNQRAVNAFLYSTTAESVIDKKILQMLNECALQLHHSVQ